MRISSVYLNLAIASALAYFCSGKPPKNTPYIRFTAQEHDLIFKMLESLAEYRPTIWKDIKKVHDEKVKAKVNGFPKPRSIRSMQQHFMIDMRNTQVPVSDALKELRDKMKRPSFTREEQDFLNRELLASDDDSDLLFNEIRWAKIEKHHQQKRESGQHGFDNKRTWDVLLHHFIHVMMPKKLVHEDVKRKFPEYFKPKQGVTSIEEGNRSGAGTSEIGLANYSEQEDELLFKMLEPHAISYDPSVWKEIEKAFEVKRNANVAGFVKPRTVNSLKQHFRTIVNNKIEVPASVREVDTQMRRTCVTRQEQDLINRELARSDLPAWPLHSSIRWKKIEEKHDEKREAGTRGFSNKRSLITLRNHFNRLMKPKNLVDEAVKRRFPKDFETNQGATSFEEGEQYDFDPEENMESCSNEDADVWDPILEDLENLQRGPIDDYGVDHVLFLDPVYDNDIYEGDSPYEIRTFEPMSP